MITSFQSLPRAIVSRLTHSCAFDLDTTIPNNECLCIGTDIKEIVKEFGRNSLYKEFIRYYNSIKDKTGKQLSENNDEQELFSYRFEEYALTKQIPLEEFEDKFLFSSMTSSRRFNFHYFRLGNGIPFLDPKKEYSYFEIDKGKPDHNRIPHLCVDSPLSALKDLRKMRFVVLRKYQICDE